MKMYRLVPERVVIEDVKKQTNRLCQLELGSVQIVTMWRTGNVGTKIDFFRHKNLDLNSGLVRYELAPRRQTATWLWQLLELPKMECEGSSYVRTAQRSLGVYDLIAAAE